METALLQVHTDIINSLQNNENVVLALLDLCAAFNTIVHSILLNHLKDLYGITGVTLQWFK